MKQLTFSPLKYNKYYRRAGFTHRQKEWKNVSQKLPFVAIYQQLLCNLDKSFQFLTHNIILQDLVMLDSTARETQKVPCLLLVTPSSQKMGPVGAAISAPRERLCLYPAQQACSETPLVSADLITVFKLHVCFFLISKYCYKF